MNRLIKFRLYCPHNKEMYYDDDENFELRIKDGEFSYIPIDDDSYCFYSNIDDNLEYECLNIIPMQFTGLYDKNGKEIYEGDVVSYTQHLFNTPVEKFPIKTKEVKWLDWEAKWNLLETNAGESNFEVIGNIHENSELLGLKR